jgi:hypothetical protein
MESLNPTTPILHHPTTPIAVCLLLRRRRLLADGPEQFALGRDSAVQRQYSVNVNSQPADVGFQIYAKRIRHLGRLRAWGTRRIGVRLDENFFFSQVRGQIQ